MAFKQKKIITNKKNVSGDGDGLHKMQATDKEEVVIGDFGDEVGERLASMRPSRELLDYYRRKVAELTSDHEAVLRRLDLMAESCASEQALQYDIRQREDEIAELQKALSDMQMYLFQEREQVLRLYAENDRLKIRELEDRKKIQHLLQLSGLNESEITYFLKVPPSKTPLIQQKVAQTNSTNKNNKPSLLGTQSSKQATVPLLAHESLQRELESYKEQVEKLQHQLEDQARLSKEQIDALIEDRRIRIEEVEAQRKRDQEKINSLSEKLKRTQDLLYDSSKDFLEQRNRFRKSEKSWIDEKDRLLRQLEKQTRAAQRSQDSAAVNNALYKAGKHNAGKAGNWASDPLDELVGGEAALIRARQEVGQQMVEKKMDELRQTIKSLEYQLEQQQKLADMYREQVIQMEDDLARVREEGDVSKEVFKDRSEKISKRLQMMNQRYQDLERRRNLEVQGFQADITNLRTKLRNLEKQLYKVTLGLADNLPMKLERPEDVDMAILKHVRATAGHSKKLTGELKNLKAMMYGLENEMRCL